jgi:hypothetical protein
MRPSLLLRRELLQDAADPPADLQLLRRVDWESLACPPLRIPIPCPDSCCASVVETRLQLENPAVRRDQLLAPDASALGFAEEACEGRFRSAFAVSTGRPGRVEEVDACGRYCDGCLAEGKEVVRSRSRLSRAAAERIFAARPMNRPYGQTQSAKPQPALGARRGQDHPRP